MKKLKMTYRYLVGTVFLLASTGWVRQAWAAADLPLENPGFEHQLEGWSDATALPMCAVRREAAHSGEAGLRVTDEDTASGSSLSSPRVPAQSRRVYVLRFWARTVSGDGLGVYLQFYNAAGALLTTDQARNQIVLSVPGGTRQWSPFVLTGRAPEKTAFAAAWIHSFNGSIVTADLDDVSLSELSTEEEKTVKTTSTISSRNAFSTPTPERIAEIVGMLSRAPAAPGDPINERRRWDVLAALPEAAGIVARAEGYLDNGPPEVPDEIYLEFSRNGNRTGYQHPYGQRSGRINALVLAECLENKGRFMAAIERDIAAMCTERSWTMPAHDSNLSNFNGTHLTIDLGSSARAWLLATADAWLGDRLSPDCRARIRLEVRRRVLDVYLQAVREGDTRGNWWMIGTNNWNAVCTASVVGAALALVDDKAEIAEILAAMEVSNPYFLSGFTEDGYCSEGMGYWNYGFGHYMMLGDEVLKAAGGKLNIFADNPKLVRIAAFPLNIMIQPRVAPAFADCGIDSRPGSDALALIHRHLPEAVPTPVRRGPLDGGITQVGLFAFDADATAMAEAQGATDDMPLRSWFEDAGILVSRSTPGTEPLFSAAFKGGHNGEHHNHNDVGSFVIAVEGTAFLLDPGGEVYTRRTFSPQRYVSKVLNSYGHPVPIVAGTLQKTGSAARAQVLAADFSADTDRLLLSLKDAYAVPQLTRLERLFENHREAHTMVIEDRVEFSSPQAFGTALVTYERVFQRPDGTVVVFAAEGAVEVAVETTGGDWVTDIEEVENPGRPSPKRLGFNLAAPAREASIRFTIRPVPLAADLPGVYVAPEVGPGFDPDLDAALTVEGEAFSRQEGGDVTVCSKVGASGQAFKFWDLPGHALTWTFTVPASGRYAIQVRACQDNSTDTSRTVLVDGRPAPAPGPTVFFPRTGGWSSTADDWRDLYLAVGGKALVAELDAGKHTVTLLAEVKGGLNLDWIRLVPLR